MQMRLCVIWVNRNFTSSSGESKPRPGDISIRLPSTEERIKVDSSQTVSGGVVAVEEREAAGSCGGGGRGAEGSAGMVVSAENRQLISETSCAAHISNSPSPAAVLKLLSTSATPAPVSNSPSSPAAVLKLLSTSVTPAPVSNSASPAAVLKLLSTSADSSMSHHSSLNANNSKTSLQDSSSLLNTLPLPSTSLTEDLVLPSSSFTHFPPLTKSTSLTSHVSKGRIHTRADSGIFNKLIYFLYDF